MWRAAASDFIGEDLLPHLCHELAHVVDVVQAQEGRCQRFPGLDEVVQVG